MFIDPIASLCLYMIHLRLFSLVSTHALEQAQLVEIYWIDECKVLYSYYYDFCFFVGTLCDFISKCSLQAFGKHSSGNIA